MDCSRGPCSIYLALDGFIVMVRGIVCVNLEPWEGELDDLTASVTSCDLLLEYLQFVFHLWVDVALGV